MAIFVVMLSMLQFSIFQEFGFLCKCVVCVCWQRHDLIADKGCVFIFLKRRCNQLFIQYSSILAYWKDCKDHRQVYLASQFKFGGRELDRNTLERGGHIP